MLYEVLIPSSDPDGYDENLTVDAGNWMAALKSGLERTGEPDTDFRNVMCDIKDDNSIHVTDAITRRVFILREVDPEVDEEAERLRQEAAEAAERAAKERAERDLPTTDTATPDMATVKLDAVQAPTEQPAKDDEEFVLEEIVPEEAAEPAQPSVVIEKQEVAPDPEDAPVDPTPVASAGISGTGVSGSGVSGSAATTEEPAKSSSGSWTSPDGRMRVGSASHDALEKIEEPKILRQTRSKTSERSAVVDVQRREDSVSENILEDIFLEIQDIHEKDMAMEDAVNFIMDLAMGKVPAESGAILFADVNGRELYFATARGPKANEIMEFRVPMGEGISGFCAKEGVSLAISDAQNDPRFYKKISDAVGYSAHSVVCAPIQHEGRVYGCIELMNRSKGSLFSSNEVNALTYIGKQFAEYINRLIMAREKL